MDNQVHLISERGGMGRLGLVWVVCGIAVSNWDATDDANEVTCENCLLAMEQEESQHE